MADIILLLTHFTSKSRAGKTPAAHLFCNLLGLDEPEWEDVSDSLSPLSSKRVQSDSMARMARMSAAMTSGSSCIRNTEPRDVNKSMESSTVDPTVTSVVNDSNDFNCRILSK